MPKKPAPVMRASKHLSDLVDANSDLPQLLCNGMSLNAITRIPNSSTSQAASRHLKNKIATMQAYRTLGKEYTANVDAFILQQMSDLKTKAFNTWSTKREYQMALSGGEVEPSKVKELELTWQKTTIELNEHMELYFPPEVRNEYITGINCSGTNPSRSDLEKSSNLPFLHCSVSMFFAMATQRCYLHTCGGYCKCTKTHSMTTFNKLAYINTSGNSKEVCVFADERCIRDFRVYSSDFTSGKMNFDGRLAIEMYRLRGIFEPESIRANVSRTMVELAHFNDPSVSHYSSGRLQGLLFVRSHPDIDVQSIQSILGITETELRTCKLELQRKDEQKWRMNQEIVNLQIKFLSEDVNCALLNNSKYGFKTLESMSSVFPGIAGVIKHSIGAKGAACVTSCFQLRMVGVCFNELSFLMGPVRKRDKAFDDSGMASREAYDFMSGKSHGILHEESPASTIASVTMGAYALQTKGKDHVIKKAVSVDTVCAAMRLFDKIDDEWNVTTLLGSYKLQHDLFVDSTDAGFVFNPLEAFTRFRQDSYYPVVKNYMKVHTGVVIPDLPANLGVKTALSEHIEFARQVFPKLAARSNTKCFALRLFGITPQTLCDIVTDTSSKTMLKKLGICVDEEKE